MVAEGEEGGIIREFGIDVCTLLYIKWTTNKDPLLGPLLKVCGSLAGRGSLGRMDTCMCMTESLCCAQERITTLLFDYTPSEIES